MTRIVDKFIAGLNDLSKEKGVIVELTESGREWLAVKGYDKKMGARPLSRVIADHIKKPLSKRMLFGDLKNGGTVSIDVNPVNDELMLVVKSDYVNVEVKEASEV